MSETHILPLEEGGRLKITIAKRKIIQSHESVEMRAESHGSSDKGKSLSLGWVRHRVFKLAQGLEVETSQILALQIGYFSCNIGILGNVVGKAGLNASVKSLASEWQWGDQEISRAEKGWELHPTKSPWSFT